MRIEALLRRRSKSGRSSSAGRVTEHITIGELTIDPLRYEVFVRGEQVNLTRKEYQILCLMANEPGKVFTRDDLINSIWGSEFETSSISIPVYIRHIREKIEEDPSDPKILQTVYRFGYRLGK